uniref:Uncharacterized protein n=1 Tax=Anguilla anguilla TaxID=7936 RepID=A0A0E9R3F2_ANGAN
MVSHEMIRRLRCIKIHEQKCYFTSATLNSNNPVKIQSQLCNCNRFSSPYGSPCTNFVKLLCCSDNTLVFCCTKRGQF